jgi:hypothetical protein
MIIGLMGFGTITGFAQSKTCACKQKTAHHRTHHTKAGSCTSAMSTTMKMKKTRPLFNENSEDTVQNISLGSVQPTPSCFVDSNGETVYMGSGSYSGYYLGENECDRFESLSTPNTDLTVTSTAFKNYGELPVKYSCKGSQVNPPLQVTNIPQGTASLALVMFDPHATAQKSTTYWVMWNLDTTGVIPEAFTTDYESQNPINKQYGYQAVCPLNGTHYYHFRVYALDTKMLLGKRTTKETLENAMSGHILAKGELIGEFNQRLE